MTFIAFLLAAAACFLMFTGSFSYLLSGMLSHLGRHSRAYYQTGGIISMAFSIPLGIIVFRIVKCILPIRRLQASPSPAALDACLQANLALWKTIGKVIILVFTIYMVAAIIMGVFKIRLD